MEMGRLCLDKEKRNSENVLLRTGMTRVHRSEVLEMTIDKLQFHRASIISNKVMLEQMTRRFRKDVLIRCPSLLCICPVIIHRGIQLGTSPKMIEECRPALETTPI